MWGALGLLALAIGSEVAATASLPRTEGFRSPGWSLLVISGYAASIWLLSIVVREIPVSTAYAVWAGAGTALVAVVGVVWLGEDWNWVTVIALAMIIVGVVALNMSGAH
jgi:small multidrug resistance pump